MSTWPDSLTSAVRLQQSVLNAFLPKASEVTPDYWAYTQWRCGHRLCSAILHNFSTQVSLCCRWQLSPSLTERSAWITLVYSHCLCSACLHDFSTQASSC